MIQRAGLKGLTFDTGHAASNPKVRGGELKLVEYVDLLRDHIRHVHFYFYESLDKGSHIPPQEWDEVAEVWRGSEPAPCTVGGAGAFQPRGAGADL